MTESTKATRATVTIGTLTIEGFRTPTGDYRMSQQQASEAIGDSPVYALRFLASKNSKALLGEAYTDYKPESIEVETEAGGRGQTRINALPIEVVSAYWLFRSHQGSKEAFTLSWALIIESLERRFDSAFEVTRTEQERGDRLSSRIQQLERDLTQLGDAYALDEVTPLQLEAARDELRLKDDEITRLREALAERGIDVDEV